MVLPPRRSLILVLCLFLMIILLVGQCHGSRATNVVNFKPKPQLRGHFLNFLPRHLPIPASGPSRKHNEIGLQGWKSP
ncbi:hypothetical protein Tsubulata_011306 [Turnera subulata]|uniref:Protein IDA-LIKE 2 n=1 Tax=Turnera subulata TaxID=218843 RepID=A0A9Q0FWY0_9ROSI|nr:hypothetical protein Tsubulata_011306 [Turnera subulata]